MAEGQRAFDDGRPPDLDLIDDCVHCGFCLPTCPTYVLWGEEMDSPRGRIVLMKHGLEEGSDMSEMSVHFDRCLGCMACVTACPSGVQYDRLIEATRPQVERNFERSPAERLFRHGLFELFTHPGRLRAAAPAMIAARRLGLHKAVGRAGVVQRFPRLKMLMSLAPKTRLRSAMSRLPEVTRARGVRRGRVGLLQGCVQRVFFGDVNRATAEVLSAEGFDVFAPRLPRCCGALMFHTGAEDDALDLAKQLIETFEDDEIVVTNAAGCGSSMKDYGHVLADDPSWGARAAAFSAKVRDVTEFLDDVEPRVPRHPLPLRIAYHDACHLVHAQAVRRQPRRLLADIPELELLEPRGWEVCCGSAGIWNLLQPDGAEELGEMKARNLLDTEADAIAAGNPGCTLQISKHLELEGKPLPVYHPIEILHASLEGAPVGKGRL